MTRGSHLPVVTEEVVGADTEEGAPTVYCRRCGNTVTLQQCGLCEQLESVDPAGEGALVVVCDNVDGGLGSGDEEELRRLLGRVVVGDVRGPWFVSTRPWTSMVDLEANAPQGTRWVVVTDPDRKAQGVVDLSQHKPGRGLTAADVMNSSFARISVDSPLAEAIDALALAGGVVVIIDDRGRAVGIFELDLLSRWLKRGVAEEPRDQTLPDGQYVFVGGQIEAVR